MAAAFVQQTPEVETTHYDEAAGLGIIALTHEITGSTELVAVPRGVLAYSGFVNDPAAGRELCGGPGAELLFGCFDRKESPEPLAGEFAVVHWSAQRQELTLATDPLGKWPLFYLQDEATSAVVFATELKCLLAHPLARREIDRSSLGQYLHHRQISPPFSGIAGISRVHYGELLRFDGAAKKSSEIYWEYPAPTAEGLTIEDWDTALRGQFRAMFSRILHGQEAVGIFLSGGLDSSLIYGLIKTDFPSIRCVPITAHYAEGSHKSPELDLPFARRLAEFWGDQLVEVELSHRQVRDRLELLLRQVDQPFYPFGNIVSYDSMTRAALERGASVVLTGQGAFESFGFSGWEPVRQQREEGRLQTFGEVHDYFQNRGVFSYSRIEQLLGVPPSEIRENIRACFQPLFDRMNSEDVFDQMFYGPNQPEAREHIFASGYPVMALSGARLFNVFYDWQTYRLMKQIPSAFKGSLDPIMCKALIHRNQQGLVPGFVYERRKRGLPGYGLNNGNLPGLEEGLLSRDVVEAQGVFAPEPFQKAIGKRKLRKSLLMAQIWLDVHVFKTGDTFRLLQQELSPAHSA